MRVCVLQGHGEADRRLSPGVGGRGRSPLIKTKQIEHVQAQPEVCTLFQTCENVGNTSEVPIAFAASIFRCLLWFQKKYFYFQIAIPPQISIDPKNGPCLEVKNRLPSLNC